MSEKIVEGKNFTSNNSRLLKHLDKIKNIQEGKPTSPVMVHLSLTNRCNLECDYCCYGNRDLKQELTTEEAKSAITKFRTLGTKGLEITGGGDPSMHKDLGTIIAYAKSIGMDVGLITNGIRLERHGDYAKNLQWMRVSLHGLNYDNGMQQKMGQTVIKARNDNPDIDISSVYIWTHNSEKTIDKVAAFTNEHKIPTRVTPDLTLGKGSIDEMMKTVGKAVIDSGGEYLFLSDFNVKTTREHDHCYMHLIKPFIFTDGYVYDCPSLALSPDNALNVNEQFRVCSIEDIIMTYTQPSRSRLLGCEFCKYAPANELIHETTKELKHGNFA